MENINCDFCGSIKRSLVARQADKIHKTTDEIFNVVKCLDCGLIYTNPRPNEKDMQRYYSENYSYHSKLNLFTNLMRMLSRFIINTPLYILVDLIGYKRKQFLNFVLPNISDPVSNYYKKNKGRGIFLDIGCGSGLTANFWGSKGSIFYYKKFAKVAGVEISNKARKFLSDRHVQSWSHIKDIPCDLRFGVIRMNWSLEHVHAPSEYFQFIRDRLEDGGVAVICVPNYEGLIYRLAKDCLELPVHLYHFTPDALVKYGEKYGLKILKIKTFSYPAMFSVASEYGLLPKNIFNNINISDAKKYQNFLNEIDLANMGNDIIAIFEKYQ